MNAFGNIIALAMRGNAEVQAQSEAKREAEKQQDALSKTSLTIQPNGRVTIKDVDPSLLNGDGQSNLDKAYTTPKINVENSLRDRGFMPDDPHKFADPTSIDSYGERYAARRKLGGGAISSAIMAGLAGGRTDDTLRQNRSNQVASTNAAMFQKFVKPVMDEEHDEAQLSASGANTHELATKRRSDLIGKVATFVPGADSNETLASLETQLGGFLPGEREQAQRALTTGRISFVSERARALAGQEGEAAVGGYNSNEISRFIGDQIGVDPEQLSERERNRVVGIFAGQQEKKREREAEAKRKEADQRLQESREARMEQLALDLKQGRIDTQHANIENKKFQKKQTLANAYDKAISDVRTTENSLNDIEALAETATGAADMALLFKYMKGLDPTSVVRESEYKAASELGSWWTRGAQSVQKAATGQKLSPENRQEIVRAVREMKKAATSRAKAIRKHYTDRAKRESIDPSEIGYDIAGADGATVRYDAKGNRQ